MCAVADDRRLAGGENDFTRWDETIFDRCLSAGFNPFGSGPTPIFLRHRDAEAPDADAKPCMPTDTENAGC